MSYREQFFALQPPGQALPTDPDSVWGRLLDGLAREYGRTENRSSALVRESDPRQSAELLPDWERSAACPETAPSPGTVPCRPAVRPW